MMKNSKEFNEILEECLERVIRGDSIDDCLLVYEKYAAELEPLLRTAAEAKGAVEIKPRPEFRARAAHEFQAALRDMEPEREERRERGRGLFGWQPRFVYAVAIVLIVLIVGSGTVAGSVNSLPDEPLYAVKIATETVQMAFTFSDESKATLYVKLADKRVDEIIKMAEKGKVEEIEDTANKLKGHLIAMANLEIVGGGDTLQDDMARFEAAEPPMQTMQPTTTPAPEPAPTPATTTPEPTVPPTEETAPAFGEVVEQVPAPTVAVPQAPEATTKGLDDNGAWPGEQSELWLQVSNSAVENSQALKALFEEGVDDDVRYALLQTLDLIAEAYDRVLRNID